MGAGLVSNDVDVNAAAHDFRQDVSAIADETDRKSATLAAGRVAKRECFVEIFSDGVAVTCVDATLDAGAIDVDGQNHSLIQGHGQGLRTAHSADTAGYDELAFERT